MGEGWGEDIVAGAGVTAVQAAGFVAVGQGKGTSWQWEAEGEIQKKMARKCAVYKFSILEFHKERGLGKEKQKNITIRENMSRTEIIKIRAEINEIENRKSVEKIRKTKSWFF